MKRKKLLIITTTIFLLFAVVFTISSCDYGEDFKISITNKEALTAEWIEGDADRELALEIKLNNVVQTDEEYTIASTDSGVVSVGDDKKTLSAVGGGIATITVKTRDVSDSVDITVTPKLTGVSITNKTLLQDVWTLGDADRELQLEFMPEYYIESTPDYTVESSDTSVIEVGEDGLTLKAKKLGTATITVTSGEFTDSVVLLVRPALESITVTNKEALELTWDDWTEKRTIELEFSPSEYYSSENTSVTITSDHLEVIDIDGYTLTAKGAVENAIITVSVGDKTDSFNINIERSAPLINFADTYNFTKTETGGTMSGLENKVFMIPNYTATASDGTNLTASVQVDLIGDASYDNITKEFIAPKGTYEIKFTVADPVDDTKITEKIIIATAYRDLLSYQDGTWNIVNPYVEDSEQTLTNSVGGYQVATFNLDASDYYYAEAEFYSEAKNDNVMGLGHYNPDNFIDGKYSRWLNTTVTSFGDYIYKVTDFDVDKFANNNGEWDLWEWNDYGLVVMHAYRLVDYRGLKFNSNPNVHKLAIARVGDYFYSFWNDQYVSMVSIDWYTAQGTIPGLFMAQKQNDTISKIDYFSGKDMVESKVNALTDNGKNIIQQYVPDDWANGSKNDDNRNFTRGETTPEKGLNFEFTANDRGFNDSMASPYVYLGGDFTFSWIYKNTSHTGSEPRMLLEVRSFRYGAEIVQFGAQYGDQRRMLLNTPNFPEGSKWYEGENDFDDSEGLKFTITRTLTESSAKYKMEVYSIANPEQRMEREIDWTGEFWNEPVVLLWHNTCVAGKYTNITWEK